MLIPVLDTLLVLLLLLNFYVLGASRLRAVINAVAFQGLLLGFMPLFALFSHSAFGLRVALQMIGTMAVKGIVIPRLLFYAMREVQVRREVEPVIGFIPSLLVGAVGTGFAVAFAQSLPLAQEHLGSLVVPAALSTVLTGFLILTSRRKAISQVVGYLVLENGIFLFGLLLLEVMPFLVEVGVLLDLFVGVFVMGIIIHHIHREFASVSTDFLSALKE
jgi:hydrogenase-4 component E